jgi:hypothetical protein
MCKSNIIGYHKDSSMHPTLLAMPCMLDAKSCYRYSQGESTILANMNRLSETLIPHILKHRTSKLHARMRGECSCLRCFEGPPSTSLTRCAP